MVLEMERVDTTDCPVQQADTLGQTLYFNVFMGWLKIVPFPVSGGEDLLVPPPDESSRGEGYFALDYQPWVGGDGGSGHGGVEVDAGDGEEGAGSVDKTRAGVENSKAGSWKQIFC